MECECSRKWDFSARSGKEPTHCYSEQCLDACSRILNDEFKLFVSCMVRDLQSSPARERHTYQARLSLREELSCLQRLVWKPLQGTLYYTPSMCKSCPKESLDPLAPNRRPNHQFVSYSMSGYPWYLWKCSIILKWTQWSWESTPTSKALILQHLG